MTEHTPIIIAALVAAGTVAYAFMSSSSESFVAGEATRMDQIDAARAADGFDIDAWHRQETLRITGGNE